MPPPTWEGWCLGRTRQLPPHSEHSVNISLNYSCLHGAPFPLSVSMLLFLWIILSTNTTGSAAGSVTLFLFIPSPTKTPLPSPQCGLVGPWSWVLANEHAHRETGYHFPSWLINNLMTLCVLSYSTGLLQIYTVTWKTHLQDGPAKKWKSLGPWITHYLEKNYLPFRHTLFAHYKKKAISMM